jgi:hypothetical protein
VTTLPATPEKQKVVRMKKTLAVVGKACLSGLLIVVPIYLAVILVLHVIDSGAEA